MAPYTCKIGGALVNVMAGSLSVQNQIGQRSTGAISIWSALGTVYQYGTAVQVYDDVGALVYSGFTQKDRARKPGGARQGTGYLEHSITLMDNAYKADKRRVDKDYLNQSAGSIVRDLLNTYLAAEGVTATATSIATGPTITEARWTYNKSVSEALTWLATQAGYWWQIDVNNVLWFQPYGGVPAPFTMDGTMADAMQDLTVEYGNDLYVNKQYVKGSYSEKGSKSNQLHETFHGDGTRRTFTLSYPISHLYQVVLNGADVTTNSLTKGQSGGQFYYAMGDPIVAQNPALAVLVSGDTLDVYYTGRVPVIAAAQNAALIAAQKTREGGNTTGLVEATYTNNKVRTLPAAAQIASSLLTHYGQDTTLLSFSTQQKGLQPGQMLNVNLPDFALSNRQMLITSVTIDDQVDGFNIWFHVSAVGSPLESAQWQTYWQNLMNQASDPSDLTDVNDATLSALILSSFSRTPSATVTKTTASCPIFSNATLFNNTTIFC